MVLHAHDVWDCSSNGKMASWGSSGQEVYPIRSVVRLRNIRVIVIITRIYQ